MRSPKPFWSKNPGLPDLLNYAVLIEPGIVLCKDGSFLVGFFFRGSDAASSSPADLNYVSALVSTYLSRFGDGWCMWVDAIRISESDYPEPERSHFPDPISALIDAERRAMFKQKDKFYGTEYALILQFIQPSKSESKFGELLYDDDTNDDEGLGGRVLTRFKKQVNSFQGGIGDLLNMRRMGTVQVSTDEDNYDSDQLVNYLHYALHGEAVALRLPKCPMYLDTWLGMESLWPGNVLKLGKKFIACVAIEGFPGDSRPGILSILDTLEISYRWSSRFIFMDQHQAESGIEKYRKYWSQTVKGIVSQVFRQEGVVNYDSARMEKEAEVSIGDAKSGAVGFGYYSPVVVLMDKDMKLVLEQAEYVKAEVQKRGFAARVEEENTLEAWLGSLPGHYRPNVRRPLIHTLNYADLLPLSAVWTGEPVNPCDFYPENSPPLMYGITTGATPIKLNVHVSDVGHVLVFGPIGAGKSTLLAFLVAQALRYQGRQWTDGTTLPASINAFDKGRSLYALCSAVGGQHYDIGSDDVSNVVLCPLAEIDSTSDALWAEEWIAICFELQSGKPLTPNQKGEVHNAIDLVRKTPASRSLTDFVAQVQDGEVREALSHYTIKGAMGHLLDGKENSMKDSNFSVFEIDELMKLGDKNALPVLLYLFHRFERALKGQPAFLSLDEAWVMLGHPVCNRYLRGWLKELRKKNCSVIIATQSLSDAVRSGILDVLVEQCPTKILLPNKEADMYGTKDNPGPADMYKAFGLTDQEINLLKNAVHKRQYYWTSPLGRRLVEFGLGPLARCFVALSDKDKLRKVRELEEAHGRDWPIYWMKINGVDYEKYKYAK